MNTYYEIHAVIDGDHEILFGSFNKADCVSEIEDEKRTWKEQGYGLIDIRGRETEDTPDPEVYPELWVAQDQTDAEYVGLIELEDTDNYFEIIKTKTHLVFGNSTNTGLMESGNYLMDLDFDLDSNLTELIDDLNTYYRDGKDYTSDAFKCNDRM